MTATDRCPVCGSPAAHHVSDEGTHSVTAVDLRRAVVELYDGLVYIMDKTGLWRDFYYNWNPVPPAFDMSDSINPEIRQGIVELVEALKAAEVDDV